MISLRELARLAAEHTDDLDRPVAPVRIGGRTCDTDRRPVLMGVVNLSRDSNYRESIAVSAESAVRKGRVLAAHGADLVDIGAESSRATAVAVDAEGQKRLLLPVIEALASDGIAVSVESYEASVVKAGLEAGACVVNLTGSQDDDTMFALAAEHGAAVVLCHVLGPHVRALDGSDVDTDPVPRMLERFGARIDRAQRLGVTDLVIDPGLGFGFRLHDQRARARYQAVTLLHSFRLRRLGVPVCHALPHAFDVFEEQFRSAEGFFAVLAHLGGAGMYRTHEVPLVRSVLDALGTFDVDR
jgi:dihydropteroate synthase